MGLKNKLLNFITPIDEETIETIELDAQDVHHTSSYEANNDPAMATVTADTKMVLFEPRHFDESEVIAQHLKQRRAAVVNLHRLRPVFSQRMIDFLYGVCFALDGDIKKIDTNAILCTPRSMATAGEITFEADLEETDQ